MTHSTNSTRPHQIGQADWGGRVLSGLGVAIVVLAGILLSPANVVNGNEPDVRRNAPSMEAKNGPSVQPARRTVPRDASPRPFAPEQRLETARSTVGDAPSTAVMSPRPEPRPATANANPLRRLLSFVQDRFERIRGGVLASTVG